MLEHAPNDHVGTDTKGSNLSTAEHTSELLYRHNQEVSCWDDGTNFPWRLKDFCGNTALTMTQPTPSATQKFTRAPPPQPIPRYPHISFCAGTAPKPVGGAARRDETPAAHSAPARRATATWTKRRVATNCRGRPPGLHDQVLAWRRGHRPRHQD
jgi:hypothetical protein